MKIRKMMAMVCALVLAAGCAVAETLSATGTVEASGVQKVVMPIGGAVETVSVEKGMTVRKGDSLLKLATTKIYATQDGTVTGVFVSPGDDADAATDTYGAALYLEGATLYKVSGSTNKAYSSVETTLVHAGETVYLQCRNATTRTGVGYIASVDGSSYTVRVTEGNFIVGDSVYIFRDDAYSATLRLGQGSVSRVSPVAVTAFGSVVNVAVKDGDAVKKGDLLLETLDGVYDGYVSVGDEVKAPVTGVVAEVSAEAGDTVSKGAVVMKINPLDGMRVEAVITAEDLLGLKVGDPVMLEAEIDESRRYEGTVSWISALPEADTEEVSYRVYIDFTPDEFVTFGMVMDVTAGDEIREPVEQEPVAAEEEPAEEEPAEDEPAADAEAGARSERPEKPEGWTRPEGDGTRPDFGESFGGQAQPEATEGTGD